MATLLMRPQGPSHASCRRHTSSACLPQPIGARTTAKPDSNAHKATALTAPQLGILRRRDVCMAASPSVEATQPSSGPLLAAVAEGRFDFACPICNQTRFHLDTQPKGGAGLSCARCARTFVAAADGAYMDLTLTSGAPPRVYEQRGWGGQELFRSPLISFVYERGWRQGFAWAGFPGADQEYDMAMKFLKQGRTRTRADSAPGTSSSSSSMGVLVDMSCGSGLFTRRFANSGAFDGVVAADFSESMLRQTRDFLKEGSQQTSCPVVLLRADIGRLPFATGSIDAIHAGAAIHCWPNPQAALAEISRVLAPGGVFVASTFLAAAAPLGQLLGNDDLVRPLNQVDVQAVGRTAQYKWWEEGELRDLCASVGMQNFQRERSWRFIMFAAQKPL